MDPGDIVIMTNQDTLSPGTAERGDTCLVEVAKSI